MNTKTGLMMLPLLCAAGVATQQLVRGQEQAAMRKKVRRRGTACATVSI